METWIKESKWKLRYELSWEFVEWIARVMSKNKDKYPPYNRQKPMDIEELRQALTRHFIEVMKGNYEDDGLENWHLYSIACNVMMILYQLKNHND